MIGAIIIFVAIKESIFLGVKAKAALVSKRLTRSLPNEDKFIRIVKDLQIVKIDYLSSFSLLIFKCQKWQ